MRTKHFRSILSIVPVAALITASFSSAKALMSSPTPVAPLRAIPRISDRPIVKFFDCVQSSGSDLREIGRDDQDSVVSVGRRSLRVGGKVYIRTKSPYSIACAIQVPSSGGQASYAFAIPDNSSLYNVRVTFYVDGQERMSKIMSRGQVRKYVVNVTDGSSFAYTLQPLDEFDGDIYIPPFPYSF